MCPYGEAEGGSDTDIEQFNANLKETGRVEAGSEAHRFMHSSAQRALRITAEINSGYHPPEELNELVTELIGKPVGEDFAMFPPFHTDFGLNISFGKGVFVNSGCSFQDQGGITVGDGTLIGHQVTVATVNHDMDPSNRGSMTFGPVAIGRNVWIGDHASVLPGVTIGDGSVVAAGAVVTRDVPPMTVVAGVPARAIRTIRG